MGSLLDLIHHRKSEPPYSAMKVEKIDMSTQYAIEQEIPTQNNNKQEDVFDTDMEVKLGILSNSLLHGSYWYLVLEIMFTTKFEMNGLARAARLRETACRESAITIMSLVKQKGGRVRLADIARPHYGREEDFTAEHAMRTMATLDTWLEQGVMKVLVDGVNEMEDILTEMMVKHREFHWESQAMKEKMCLPQYRYEK